MFDIQKMMKKAQEMQAEMEKVQDELATIEVIGSAGGGKVTVKANGKHEFLGVSVDPEVAGDKDLLEDLFLTALKDLNKKVAEETKRKMERVTGGLNIPGLKLPF